LADIPVEPGRRACLLSEPSHELPGKGAFARIQGPPGE
jgi:hypothetical protein